MKFIRLANIFNTTLEQWQGQGEIKVERGYVVIMKWRDIGQVSIIGYCFCGRRQEESTNEYRRNDDIVTKTRRGICTPLTLSFIGIKRFLFIIYAKH
jgi:hypothetical protein